MLRSGVSSRLISSRSLFQFSHLQEKISKIFSGTTGQETDLVNLPTIFGVYKHRKKGGVINYEHNGTQGSISYNGDFIKSRKKDGVKVVFKLVTDKKTSKVSVKGLYQMPVNPVRRGLISWDPETKTGVLKDIKNDELHTFEIDSWEDSSNLDNYFNDHEIEFHSAHQIIESGSSKLKAFKVRAPSAIVEDDESPKGDNEYKMVDRDWSVEDLLPKSVQTKLTQEQLEWIYERYDYDKVQPRKLSSKSKSFKAEYKRAQQLTLQRDIKLVESLAGEILSKTVKVETKTIRPTEVRKHDEVENASLEKDRKEPSTSTDYHFEWKRKEMKRNLHSLDQNRDSFKTAKQARQDISKLIKNKKKELRYAIDKNDLESESRIRDELQDLEKELFYKEKSVKQTSFNKSELREQKKKLGLEYMRKNVMNSDSKKR